MWRYFLLLFGVFSCATAIIMIKLSATSALLLPAIRLVLASLFLSPLFFRALRKHPYTWGHVRRSLIPGARMTGAANAVLLVTMLPAIMPLVMWLLVKELLTRRELLGTALCLTGVFILSYEGLRVSMATFLGDMVCFGSMIFYAFYLGLGRKNNDFADLWLYVVPIYFFAGLMCYAITAAASEPLLPANAYEWGLVLGLTILPTVTGHTIMNYSMQTLRGQIVSIFSLTQFIFAAILAYFILGEVPHWQFYVAVVFVLAGALTVIFHAPQVAKEEDHAEA